MSKWAFGALEFCGKNPDLYDLPGPYLYCLGLFLLCAEEECFHHSHQNQYGAECAYDSCARGSVKEHGTVATQCRNQCSHGPADGKPCTNAVSKQHGSHG